jgi:hypothetical protein
VFRSSAQSVAIFNGTAENGGMFTVWEKIIIIVLLKMLCNDGGSGGLW